MFILHIVGARPNFMKAAAVLTTLGKQRGVRQALVHTGQHYDTNMSQVFLDELGLPSPDVNLEVGSSSHAVQTAQAMQRLEGVLLEQDPDWVLVYGDVNSTLAAALVCAKLLIPVGHVEAGLRSFDRAMPEEINRLLTDQVADLLFVPSSEGVDNLKREGVSPKRIHLVGNVMIDTLVRLLPLAAGRWDSHRLEFWRGKQYALVTLHRPSNVDHPEVLGKIMSALDDIGRDVHVVFPVHPRTRAHLGTADACFDAARVQLIEPLGYLDFLALQSNAALVITDSGGIQEETTYLGIPCLTVRENTERPITVTIGTNTLVGQDMTLLRREASSIMAGRAKKGQIPPLWDGRAAERIATILHGV